MTYLLDTHALFFWVTTTHISEEFLIFLDRENKAGRLWVSTVSFWEIALLAKKGRLEIENVTKWKNQVVEQSGLNMLTPSPDDMIASTLLPDHHRDPFDRLLIAQARHEHSQLVTKDKEIGHYAVKTFWMN